MITKYSSNQISLLNQAHLDSVEWVKYSDHTAIVDGLRIILDTDLNYQGALADCEAFEAKITKSKTNESALVKIIEIQTIEIDELKKKVDVGISFERDSPEFAGWLKKKARHHDAEVIRTMLSSDRIKITPIDNLKTVVMIIEEYADYLENRDD